MSPLAAFILQFFLAVAALLLATRVARASPRFSTAACIVTLAILLAWPLMRLFPVAVIDLLGAPPRPR